jgi:hypothetical protein
VECSVRWLTGILPNRVQASGHLPMAISIADLPDQPPQQIRGCGSAPRKLVRPESYEKGAADGYCNRQAAREVEPGDPLTR